MPPRAQNYRVSRLHNRICGCPFALLISEFDLSGFNHFLNRAPRMIGASIPGHIAKLWIAIKCRGVRSHHHYHNNCASNYVPHNSAILANALFSLVVSIGAFRPKRHHDFGQDLLTEFVRMHHVPVEAMRVNAARTDIFGPWRCHIEIRAALL